MPITSQLNLGLPATPLAEDPKLNAELQIIYNALHNIAQVLNDAGLPPGGISPSPIIADVAHGGTGVATATGVLVGSGTSPFTAVAGGTVGHQLRVKTVGPTTYEFSASGTGDVVGPTGATDNSVALFDGITGKLLKSRASFTFDGITMQVAADYPGNAMESVVENTNISVANSNAIRHTIVGSGAAGSAFNHYELVGSDEWVAGIDTADNFYRIARGADFVTGTSAFAINPITGAITTAAGTLGTSAYIILGANVGTFLATPSSANLRAALTDETGTGAAVFATAPSFTGGVGLSGTAAGANGIAFPAAVAAVADPNTLDDYEEGIWNATPWTNAGAFTTVSFAGTYTKIGNMVFANGLVTITNNGTASGAILVPVPFPISGSLTGSGCENVAAGFALAVAGNGTTDVVLRKYDFTYAGGTGYGLTVSIAYPI